jgi:RNA polymerase primary sigma factor
MGRRRIEIAGAVGPVGVDQIERRDLVDEFLRPLSPREQTIVRMRYGLVNGIGRTVEEVGRHFNVTRERIRLLEARALRKMRKAAKG